MLRFFVQNHYGSEAFCGALHNHHHYYFYS